jgi:IS30 family transposase
LIQFLTKSHKKRRKRANATQKQPKIHNRVMIEERTDYITLRSTIGHWEIDTAVSRQSKAAIMVLGRVHTRQNG